MSKYCWAWDRIYVKANGRIPCWCDSGEKHTITEGDLTKSDFVRDILNNPEMREMRLSVIERQEDYVKYCKNCCCMIKNDKDLELKRAKHRMEKTQRKRGWEYGSIDYIEEIQVEPSFPCNLKCPGCLQGKVENPLETEKPPYVLGLNHFKRMIDSCLYNNVTINRIAFVGRGEPTLCKDFTRMIDYLDGLGIHTTMDTNSNQPFKPSYAKLTWINCSIDGSSEESYSKYRRGGKFHKTLKFMEDGVKAGASIRWKYILFDTTDSDGLLLKALRTAKEIGIKELKFIITKVGSYDNSVNPSKRSKEEIKRLIESQNIFENVAIENAT